VAEIEDEMAQIADAITAIGKYDKPLAEHLKASIKHGNEVVYRPRMPIAWDVRSIVNE